MNSIIKPCNSREDRFLRIFKIAVMILSLTVTVLWSLQSEISVCPDERMRLEMVSYICENGSLPVQGDPQLRDETYGFSYATAPPLPYLCGALLMKLASLLPFLGLAPLYAPRIVSFLACFGFLFLAGKIAEMLFRDRVKQGCFLCFCAFWPQLVFVFSYFNCDALCLFGTALSLFFLLKAMNRQWSVRDCIGIGVGVAICVLTYYNSIAFILGLVFTCLIVNIRQQAKPKQILIRALYVVVTVLVLVSWHFIRNALLYDGDFFGFSTTRALGEMYAAPGYTPTERAARSAAMLATPSMILEWFVISAKSFIALFGYMNVIMGSWVYKLYALFLLFAVIGVADLFRLNRKNMKATEPKLWLVIGLLISAVLVLALSFYHSFADYQAQGRYLFPGFLFIAWLLAEGLGHLDRYTKKIHIRVLPIVAFCTVMVLFACFRCILTVY